MEWIKKIILNIIYFLFNFLGFKNLSPKMTVVKKSTNDISESPNSYLPTVMTCQNYLKVPDYSSYEIFKQRFTTAIYEGLNAFHLS